MMSSNRSIFTSSGIDKLKEIRNKSFEFLEEASRISLENWQREYPSKIIPLTSNDKPCTVQNFIVTFCSICDLLIKQNTLSSLRENAAALEEFTYVWSSGIGVPILVLEGGREMLLPIAESYKALLNEFNETTDLHQSSVMDGIVLNILGLNKQKIIRLGREFIVKAVDYEIRKAKLKSYASNSCSYFNELLSNCECTMEALGVLNEQAEDYKAESLLIVNDTFYANINLYLLHYNVDLDLATKSRSIIQLLDAPPLREPTKIANLNLIASGDALIEYIVDTEVALLSAKVGIEGKQPNYSSHNLYERRLNETLIQVAKNLSSEATRGENEEKANESDKLLKNDYESKEEENDLNQDVSTELRIANLLEAATASLVTAKGNITKALQSYLITTMSNGFFRATSSSAKKELVKSMIDELDCIINPSDKKSIGKCWHEIYSILDKAWYSHLNVISENGIASGRLGEILAYSVNQIMDVRPEFGVRCASLAMYAQARLQALDATVNHSCGATI